MNLAEAVERLKEFEGDDTIYASAPWTEESAAIVASEPESGGLPAEASKAGLKYFLEVSIAREVIEDWISGIGRQPDARAICQRLIQYAINDA
jgi:hypothetical protein